MILVDTSIWVDHLHRRNTSLIELMSHGEVATHAMIVGELALGTVADRSSFLRAISRLTRLPTARHDELLLLVDTRHLYGRGVNLVDAHLLASVLISDSVVWTRDRRLQAAAAELDVLADVKH